MNVNDEGEYRRCFLRHGVAKAKIIAGIFGLGKRRIRGTAVVFFSGRAVEGQF